MGLMRRRTIVLSWVLVALVLAAANVALMLRGNLTIEDGFLFSMMRALPVITVSWLVVGLGLFTIGVMRRSDGAH